MGKRGCRMTIPECALLMKYFNILYLPPAGAGWLSMWNFSLNKNVNETPGLRKFGIIDIILFTTKCEQRYSRVGAAAQTRQRNMRVKNGRHLFRSLL